LKLRDDEVVGLEDQELTGTEAEYSKNSNCPPTDDHEKAYADVDAEGNCEADPELEDENALEATAEDATPIEVDGPEGNSEEPTAATTPSPSVIAEKSASASENQ